jgi:multiple sugar transport system substrate-binding protein
MPILSNDPTSHPPDKLAILQDSDKWSAIPGYPGPATPATDEIYYAFILNDMMAKAATDQSSAEDAVKSAAQQCEIIMKKWAGKA